jgi:putative FmdB family regulatory protein
MPIYAYRCAACGHTKDVLQKINEAPLHTCPVCGARAFTKQVTAAGFQLKGSGWYATDFKSPAPAGKTDNGAADAGKADAGKGDAKDGAAAAPAPAPASGTDAPAAKPAPAGTPTANGGQ